MKDKFDNFYIEYEVEETYWIKATIWEVAGWMPDGAPCFYNAGPTAPMCDPTKAEPLLTGNFKWDGCTHLYVPSCIHFDSLDKWESISRVVRYLWEDVCNRHDVCG